MADSNTNTSLSRAPDHLGDFTLTPRVLYIVLLALLVGALSAYVAIALLDLIGLFTNLVFYQRIATVMVAPSAAQYNPTLILLAPVAGGLIVGLMARYGSEAIRGHGMPETIDAVLRRGSKVQPRVAFLKPVSAAIMLGTGGPFGAEGPIIMTGGAFGSVLAQFLRLTADERKTLLVSGAVGGMAATFNAPFASILLAVELLLFEWRPRSFLPVASAVAMATVLRGQLLGFAPIFGVNDPQVAITAELCGLSLAVGLSGGLLAMVATRLVYFSEDTFKRLPVHWMWWPAIGGLIIGVGGLFEPRALGVGYDVIRDLLNGRMALAAIASLLIVKTLIWSLSLGSGTSGGVLAPIVMLGAALGGLEGHFFPAMTPAFWSLVGLAAVIGGAMRIPLTGVIFALELTHEWSALLPLAIAASTAFGMSALLLKRSILTEKVARRGFHLSREYSVDPLEVLFVREAMATEFISFRADASLREAAATFLSSQSRARHVQHRQRLYPVLDADGRLVGVVTRRDMLDWALTPDLPADFTVERIAVKNPVTAYPDETLRQIAYRFADTGVSRVPVVERADPRRVVGVITLVDVLKGRLHDLQEERAQERVLTVSSVLPLPGGRLRVRRRRPKPEQSDGAQP